MLTWKQDYCMFYWQGGHLDIAYYYYQTLEIPFLALSLWLCLPVATPANSLTKDYTLKKINGQWLISNVVDDNSQAG